MKDRKFLRFQPDENTLALIDLKFSTKEFKPSISGLILNESYSGCAIVVASDVILKLGSKVKIKIGNLHVMKAEVVWAKILEENIQKIGIKLLE
ncbi:MAG: hypothetical protein L6Q37_05190 [Bdellovibrionaceae bacterium]|nr:hypothetical protein [Pseudobdellovibrionaceae bacterium]NUM60066.1 hypothetical protein [Pseudobdellovibrionaceae bacterium]